MLLEFVALGCLYLDANIASYSYKIVVATTSTIMNHDLSASFPKFLWVIKKCLCYWSTYKFLFVLL